MINRFVGAGRLTKDPELRYTQNGVAVANFGIAINRPFTNQQGEREADFLNVTAWRKQAENVANYLKKGALVGIDGRLQSRTFETQDGSKRFVVGIQAESVQFLEPKGNKSQNEQKQPQQDERSSQDDKSADPFANDGQPINISDDDLPF
ncbi:single-strand binding protein [Alteribacillus persepolensis]|uniref:Single-stranded DNA-binding protein n=1 Tax=Alteribacillus persepolensis TaxID=568899 RepID=A0A1G8I9M2_9BACI|nr:single-stranded DNA-binding protein [Alteribacillus persepolensis]SDI15260.1 single-strand binding protein [Alteribacillus persepolensis]